MSINKLRITPTPSNTATNTPTITPTLTSCPGICFSGVGTNAFGTVNAIVQDVLDPTKMMIVGAFTSYNGVSRLKLVRSYTDGEVDLTFDPSTSIPTAGQTPLEITQQPDGKYVIVGNFTTYRGTNRNRIARINYDGTLDTSFVIGTGFSQSTYYVAQDTGGKLLVCSQSSQTYSGVSVGLLCRLNSNGSLDTTFQNNTLTGNTIANKVIRNSDGTYYVSGVFTRSGRSNLVKLNSDGSYASSDPFNTSGVGFVGSVNDFEVLPDGKLIVVGDFTVYNGVGTGRGMIRLNANGTKDATFATPGYGNYQYEVLLQGSKYISVGFGYTYSGIAINNITRINSNGTLDTSWNSGNFTSITTEDLIQHLVMLTGATSDSGYIFCGGFFNSYDGVLTENIVKMNRDGFAADCDPIVVSPTPTNTPTRTPTPSITATITSTPTNTPSPTSLCCSENIIATTLADINGATGNTDPFRNNALELSYYDCNGDFQVQYLTNAETYNVCGSPENEIFTGYITVIQYVNDVANQTIVLGSQTMTGGTSLTFGECCNVITPTMTSTPSSTPTSTPPIITPSMTSTNTGTPTNTPTNTQTSTPTSTIGLTPTMTSSETATPTITPTNTSTPTNTPTNTQTSTPTGTIQATPTQTSTPSATPENCSCYELTYTMADVEDISVRWRNCDNDTITTTNISSLQSIDNNDGTFTTYICVKQGSSYSTPVCVENDLEIVCPTGVSWILGGSCSDDIDCFAACVCLDIITNNSLDIEITQVEVDGTPASYLGGQPLPNTGGNGTSLCSFISGNVDITVYWTASVPGQHIDLIDSNNVAYCQNVSGSGSHTFTGVELNGSQCLTIQANDGTC